jgi:hypothetical protein
MNLRIVGPLMCGILLACESTTGPDLGDWELAGVPHQSRLSADLAMAVLTSDGRLYTWGEGASGTLGQGNLKSFASPKEVPGLEGVIDFSQSGGMAFALNEDGSLYQWGHYMFSSIYPHPTPNPTKAGKVEGAVSVFAEVWTLYIVDDAGRLWNVSPSHVHPSKTPAPHLVPRPKKVAMVSGGIGLFQDGTLFDLESIGPDDGGTVAGFGGVTAVFNNFENTVALKGDGTVWAWGHDQHCGLGDDVHLVSDIPVQIPGLTGVRRISGKGGFRFALKEDGTVWYWGYRGWNEDHSPICQMTPAQVPEITDAVDVAAHWEALIGTADGRLYTFDPKTLEVKKVPGT